MAHRRSAQSAPSYMSEREAEGTHVVGFVTLFHSVSSYVKKKKTMFFFFSKQNQN